VLLVGPVDSVDYWVIHMFSTQGKVRLKTKVDFVDKS